MVQAFRQFIKSHQLLTPGDRCLLAVSGGVDSMVMAHLFLMSGLPFGIAHCNFKLRGKTSDEDQRFVAKFADAIGVPFFFTSFDTRKAAEDQGVSIQEVARKLRYNWLAEIREDHEYNFIATAHQLNDSLETILYNFTKGTGIRGLHGIPVRNGRIIRPLLFAQRDLIEAFAREQEISFREDASNTSAKYARNRIRQEVIPVLKELNPALEQTAGRNIKYLQDAEYLMNLALENLYRQLVKEQGEELYIDLHGLKKYPAAETILFEWTRTMGFKPSQIAQALGQRKDQPGALFFSATHRMLFDRRYVIISPSTGTSDSDEHLIEVGRSQLILPGGVLSLQRMKGPPPSFPESNWAACLDADKLTFPLRLRRWQKGDYFMPLGMSGKRQKLKDFFVRQKVTRFEKERIWILETSAQDICWIVGYRLDDRFKTGPETTGTLILKFTPS